MNGGENGVASGTSVIWLHEDALRREHPVFAAAPQRTPAIHIWDDARLREAGYSLKRLIFLYETVSELGIAVLRGETRQVLESFAAETIYVPESPDPAIRRCLEGFAKKVVWVAEEPFVVLKGEQLYPRFFRYWSRAERLAMSRDGGRRGAHAEKS